jgi:hypothetical protein
MTRFRDWTVFTNVSSVAGDGVYERDCLKGNLAGSKQ